MKIVVLAGGLSTERDVSLVTGTMVSKALRSKGHQALLLDVFIGYGKPGDSLDGIFDRNGAADIAVSGISNAAPDIEKIRAMREDPDCFFGPNVLALCRMADIVFMALHGENGENGKVQAAFDLFGIRYTGSNYLSSAIAMNKALSKRFFLEAGIPVPTGVHMKKSERTTDISAAGLTLPCIVKPCCGGSSIGISIVHTPQEYEVALDAAFSLEDEVIVENYIQGREFSVAVIAYKALPIIEIAPKEGFYNYENKYKPGNTIETCPADLPPAIFQKIQEYAVHAAVTLGLDTYSRVDFMLDSEDRVYCLEVNTLPGMTPTSLLPQEAQAIGMRFEDLCEKLIRISMEKFRQE